MTSLAINSHQLSRQNHIETRVPAQAQKYLATGEPFKFLTAVEHLERKAHRLGSGAIILHNMRLGGLSKVVGSDNQIRIPTAQTMARSTEVTGTLVRTTSEFNRLHGSLNPVSLEQVELEGSILMAPAHLGQQTLHALGDFVNNDHSPTLRTVERLAASLNSRAVLPSICGAVIVYNSVLAEGIVFNNNSAFIDPAQA